MNISHLNSNSKGIKNIRAKIKIKNFKSIDRSENEITQNGNSIDGGKNNDRYSPKFGGKKTFNNEMSFNDNEIEIPTNTTNRETHNFTFDYDKENKNTIYNSDTSLDEDNYIIQSQAKELIQKTKSMMDNIRNSELNNISHSTYTPKNSKKIIKSDDKNRDTDSNMNDNFYNEEKPFDYSKIAKIEKDEAYKNCLITNNINSQLLEKIKIIKNLEREIKQKNIIIDKLTSKLDKQNEEFKKNNDKLNSEKNSRMKSEILVLNKRLKEKEDDYVTKTKLFDSIIEEYRVKVEDLLFVNENAMNKVKELENKLKRFYEKEKNLQINFEELITQKIEFENLSQSYKEKLESEIKEKTKLEDKNNNLINYCRNMVEKMNQIHDTHLKQKIFTDNFIKHLCNFYTISKCEYTKINEKEIDSLLINN